jgi:glycosyltransferase involved in cell wall biosynthesis
VIACLVPVRNGADVLPEWLDEAARFADAIVALDDGSTDDTGAVLRSHPLVARVLANRPRPGFLGWHDGINRNRLLATAADLAPEWVFSLDVDERLDPTDADAMRRFVAGETIASCVYGFQVFRMLEGETYDPRPEMAYRLFRFRQGQRFPHQRLHSMPVPTEIPASVETTLRIKHYGDVGEQGRQARIAKLREADPEGAYRAWYEQLAPLSPGPHPCWSPRDASMPVLRPSEGDLAALDLEGPISTVAVVVEPGEGAAATGMLRDLAAEGLTVPTQVLAVTCDTAAAAALRIGVPQVEVLLTPGGSSPGALRNTALHAARGDYVIFLTVPVPVESDALAAAVEAHERGHALVGGRPINLTTTAAGWAGFLLDHPSRADDDDLLPSARYSSFAREPLLRLGGFDERSETPEALAGRALLRAGFTATVVPALTLARRPPSSMAALLRQRFELGRAIVPEQRARPAEVGIALLRLGRASLRRVGTSRARLTETVDQVPASRLAVSALMGAGAASTVLGAAREWLSRQGRPQRGPGS